MMHWNKGVSLKGGKEVERVWWRGDKGPNQLVLTGGESSVQAKCSGQCDVNPNTTGTHPFTSISAHPPPARQIKQQVLLIQGCRGRWP